MLKQIVSIQKHPPLLMGVSTKSSFFVDVSSKNVDYISRDNSGYLSDFVYPEDHWKDKVHCLSLSIPTVLPIRIPFTIIDLDDRSLFNGIDVPLFVGSLLERIRVMGGTVIVVSKSPLDLGIDDLDFGGTSNDWGEDIFFAGWNCDVSPSHSSIHISSLVHLPVIELESERDIVATSIQGYNSVIKNILQRFDLLRDMFVIKRGVGVYQYEYEPDAWAWRSSDEDDVDKIKERFWSYVMQSDLLFDIPLTGRLERLNKKAKYMLFTTPNINWYIEQHNNERERSMIDTLYDVLKTIRNEDDGNMLGGQLSIAPKLKIKNVVSYERDRERWSLSKDKVMLKLVWLIYWVLEQETDCPIPSLNREIEIRLDQLNVYHVKHTEVVVTAYFDMKIQKSGLILLKWRDDEVREQFNLLSQQIIEEHYPEAVNME